MAGSSHSTPDEKLVPPNLADTLGYIVNKFEHVQGSGPGDVPVWLGQRDGV